MNFNHRPMGLSLLALALVTGPGLVAQERAHQAQPDPAAAYKLNYKRFTRNGDEKIVDEAWERRQYWLERMGGELGPDFFRRVVREAEAQRAKHPERFAPKGAEVPAAVTPGVWVNIGPTSSDFTQNSITLNKVDSGRARSILPHPTDPNTVYFLNAGGGLWKTTNFTSPTPSWTATTDFVGSAAGGAAAFGRTPSVLYYGTGDSFDGGVGGFITKSTDGATTWDPAVFLAGATRIHDLKVETTVGTDSTSDIILAATNVGLFRSANGGTSFTLVPTMSGETIWSIVKTSAGWLASTYSGGTGSLKISMDNGATWNPITNAGTVFTGAGRATLGVGAAGDAVVYCFASDTGSAAQLDLFRSSNGGQTWVALGLGAKVPSNPNSDQSNMDLMAGQAWYNQMVLVDPSDATRNTIYLGGQLAGARSKDGGASWTLISDWLAQGGLQYIHADFHSAAFSNAGGTNRLFIGTDGGLFTSTDGGVTWDDTKNKGLATHLIYALAVNPSLPASALVGLQDNGTRSRVLTPTPNTTFNQIRGGDGFGVGWAPASGISLSSYVYNQIRKSTTNPPVDQDHFLPFVSGLAAQTSTNFYFVTPIATPTAAADPSGNVFFTYGKTKVYKSNATGWTAFGTVGAAGIPAGRVMRSTTHGLGVHPSDLNRIAVAGAIPGSGGGAQGYVWVTTNGGTSWTEAFLGSTGTNGQNIGWYGYNSNMAWVDNNTLFAASEATNAGAAHVAKSVNGGVTWTRKDSGLPDVPVNKIVVDPGDATGNTAYAATWIGVYRTTNGGTSWSLFGTGLPQAQVSDIFVAPDSSFIRVSTWGRGVWDMVLDSVVIAPTSATLLPGDTATFLGTVNGGGTTTFTATGGTVSAGGVYTAGVTPGTYAVTATNALNPGQTAVATITIQAIDPVAFTTQPVNRTGAVGQTSTFTVAATGTGPLSYQWKKGGVAIPGAIAPIYTTPVLAPSDNGATYTCEVTGRSGTLASNSVTLTVMALGTAVTTNHSTATPLPDSPTTTNIPIVVSGITGNTGEVTFSIYLTHTYVGDLVITLLAPDGTPVVLSQNAGSTAVSPTGAAFGTSCGNYVVFSDQGASSISTQVAPPAITGTFRPSGSLSGFTGTSPNGTWTLRIQDVGPGDTGTYQCSVLSIKPLIPIGPSYNINGDGATDAYDLLEFLKLFGSSVPADLAKADFDTDGQINDADLTLLLNAL